MNQTRHFVNGEHDIWPLPQLADGAIVTVNGNDLQASYSGGEGNHLTLTVVP